MIIRRLPLSVLVAVWGLLACSALLVVASGATAAFGIFSDDPLAGEMGVALSAFLLLPAAVFFVAARHLGHGSGAAWSVSLVLAISLAVNAVTEDERGVIEGISGVAGAILIASLLWPSTTRYVWERPNRELLRPAATPTASDRSAPEEP
jgi:hypothetical protein